MLMDNLKCRGTEGRLQDRQFRGWKKHDCDHDKYAEVVCNEEIPCKETINKRQIETSYQKLFINSNKIIEIFKIIYSIISLN